MREEGPQAKRTRELIEQYASFNLMSPQDKARITHICGILSYLELAYVQRMTVEVCIDGLEKFLKGIRKKYMGDEEDKKNVTIVD